MWKQIRDANWKIPCKGGWCLKYVREAFGTGSYPYAIDAWNASNKKHYDYPPLGITVPVFFALGSEPAGHVAIRLDDLYVASSTQSGTHPQGYLHKNIQDLVTVYAKYNKGCTYLGWTEDLAGTILVKWEEPVIAPPVVKPPVVTPPVVAPPVVVPEPPVEVIPPIVEVEPPIIEEPIVEPPKKTLIQLIIQLIESILKLLTRKE